MYKMTTYLTEKPLGDILRSWAGDENVIPQPIVLGTRMRHDYVVRKDGVTYAVEFDGDSHYRDPIVIFRDWIKDRTAAELGMKVVRIPYFIQLDSETFKVLFGVDFDIETTYPHGFVAAKFLPASFCPKGYERALYDLDRHSAKVNSAVSASLIDKANKLGDSWVYFKNSVTVDGEDIPWDEFVSRANEVHDNKYTYTHPL